MELNYRRPQRKLKEGSRLGDCSTNGKIKEEVDRGMISHTDKVSR